jgi:bifunctional oligoribonuclease and PAP phosphatase NrnA
MDTSLFQPITNLIEKSQNILVLSHAKPDADALGASLSFYLAMKELGKQVTVVTNEPTKENMAFLPAINTLQYTLGGTKDFIISLDTTNK